MSKSMLEYTQTILHKVSFDPILFNKELKKALKRLLPDEVEELREWLYHYIIGKPELEECLIYLR